MASDDSLTRQIEEIEALSSIYGDEWCVIDEIGRVYCIAVSDTEKPSVGKICLQVLLPEDYPNESSPIFQINGAWLKPQERCDMLDGLNEICKDNMGESVIFLMVEYLREFIIARPEEQEQNEDRANVSQQSEEVVEVDDPEYQVDVDCIDLSQLSIPYDEDDTPDIIHGEPTTDRRSTFQGHLAKVTNVKQVKLVLNSLYENRKIANATHNIYAYRIHNDEKNTVIQDCEDDGETAAGGRLLHLLQILNVSNVLVVVSRWYGGILLGPDRFKHINNAARSILQANGYIEKKEETTKKSKQKRHGNRK
ncbi:protein IMPACT-B-like [Glandiceps talaboti]